MRSPGAPYSPMTPAARRRRAFDWRCSVEGSTATIFTPVRHGSGCLATSHLLRMSYTERTPRAFTKNVASSAVMCENSRERNTMASRSEPPPTARRPKLP